MRNFLAICSVIILLAPLPARAQTPAPSGSVYQGKTLKLSLEQTIRAINALSPITYTDPQTTKVFSTTPAGDIEKIAVSKTGGRIEFFSNDSLDGMALESAVTVTWPELYGNHIFVVNDPEAGADYQVQVFGGGDVIDNSFRDVDDTGHLAAEQQGDPAAMFGFDNAGNLAKAKHVADLLTTLVALAGTPPAAPLAAAPAVAAPAALAAKIPDQPSGEMKLALADAPAAPLPDDANAGSSYFEGPFAVRVGPSQAGVASVDVVNISNQTHRVNIAVVNCQNVASDDCGTQFDGKLAPGMKLSFSIHNDDSSQTAAFHVNAAAHDEMVAEITPQTATH